MRAIRILETGGPEQLKLEHVDIPKPGPGQALVKLAAAGVNYIDVYQRSGLYKIALPFTLGMEGAGTVEAIADGITAVRPGDRVCYASVAGAYAEYAVVPLTSLIPVPPGLDLQLGAASMLQGMTAHYLTQSTYALKPGDTCLVHAAAGGTGGLIVQMAKMLGARVIGTTSTAEKAEHVKNAGADHVILYNEKDFDVEARRLTDGRGVDVVYDSVGKSTWDKSLNALRPLGMMVSFGNASGAVGTIDPLVLSQKGSLYLTRPTLANYISDPDLLRWRAGDVLRWVADGKLKIHIGGTYTLDRAEQAHRDLESRSTRGKLLLTP